MKFEIKTKDDKGEVVFQGTANQNEASFLLEVGINYLLAQGAMPMLTGDMNPDSTMVEQPEAAQ